MSIKEQLEKFATQCREARERGDDLPTWEGASLQHADLEYANMEGAMLQRADLRFANLNDANLRDANLEDAMLQRADLRFADLRSANLNDANLRDVNLEGEYLEGINLEGARMPDGRVFEDYIKDPLAGICEDPEARKRAIAAWGNHSWDNCPMHEAHGWSKLGDVPNNKRIAVSAFISLFDGKLLQKPEVR